VTPGIIATFFSARHRLHGGERRFNDRVVPLVLQAVLAEHGAHRDVDRAAGSVSGNHLAVQILNRLDRTIGKNKKFAAVIAVDTVLKLIGDDAEIVHVGILNGERKRRIGQVANFNFVRRERGDHGRCPVEAHVLKDVGLSEMLSEVLLLEQE
jgi:hypothetical protein